VCFPLAVLDFGLWDTTSLCSRNTLCLRAVRGVDCTMVATSLKRIVGAVFATVMRHGYCLTLLVMYVSFVLRILTEDTHAPDVRELELAKSVQNGVALLDPSDLSDLSFFVKRARTRSKGAKRVVRRVMSEDAIADEFGVEQDLEAVLAQAATNLDEAAEGYSARLASIYSAYANLYSSQGRHSDARRMLVQAESFADGVGARAWWDPVA